MMLQNTRHFVRNLSTTRKTADAVVIGAGVIGSSIALNLARRGYDVVVFDEHKSAGAGSTSYSSGVCRMFFSVLDSVKLSWEGYHNWLNWEEYVGVRDERGLASLKETGGLMLESDTTKEFLRKCVPLLEQVGIPFQRLNRQELEEQYGSKSVLGLDLNCYGPPKHLDDVQFGVPNENDEVVGGIYIPQTGYVSDPQLATLNLQLAAECTNRAHFHFQSTVTAIKRSSGRVSGVTLQNGSQISAPIVVNATGPSSNKMTNLAFGEYGDNDMTVTTRPLRQEVAYVSAPEGAKNLPIMGDVDVGVYVRPELGSQIVIGSTEPACDALEFLDREGDANLNLTSLHTALIYRWALRMPQLPLPSAADARGVVACYDVTEDWTPIYDKSALPGFFMAIGTSGNQFKNAGVVGEMMTELIDRSENQDVSPLQFQLATTGGMIDTSMFSRLRKPLNTSNSVLA